jgi:hypothetical protein
MREVFASINYVINKLEEKNLFKIAQEGHDIFAAVYRFVRDEQNGELVRPDDDKSEQYYESAAPSNMFENDLYSPMDKNKQRKWRVKSEVPSEYGTAPASSASPSATDTPSAETFTSEAPSAGPSVTPESASVTVTTPSSYSRTEGTSSESSSSTSTPSGSGPSFNMGSGEASVDPTKVEYFDIGTLVKIVDYLMSQGATSAGDFIERLSIKNTTVLAALPILMKLGVIKKTDYKYEIAKPKDQVFKILTKYMLHHKDEQSKYDIIDVDVEDPNEDTNEVRQIGERNNPTSDEAKMLGGSDSPRQIGERNNPASDETKIPGGSFGSENRSSGGFFGGAEGRGGGFGGGSERRRKVYPSTVEGIRKTQEKLDVIVKELDEIFKMPDKSYLKEVLTNFLRNKDLIEIVSDPNFEQNYSINSDTTMTIEFIHYPGKNIVGLKVNGQPVIQFGKRR